ncbi:MAG: hypothetical protein ABJP41_04440 [Paracoccaceae bacterium]
MWSGTSHAATMVLVGEEVGHAVLVQHRGNCYAVMPDHVAFKDRLSLVSALPQVTGVATVFHRRSDLDLAIGFVEGDLAQACDLTWVDLSKDVSKLVGDTASGGLSRIQFGGKFIDRAAATIIDADDNHFVIATTQEWSNSEIMGGVSGALFYVRNIPVGIALTSEDTSRARFLRMDRVHQALSSVLEASGGKHPVLAEIKGAQDGIGYRVTSQARVLNGVRRGLTEALDTTWDGADLEIEFTLSNSAPIPLRSILLESAAANGLATFPQDITLQLDRGSVGQTAWREIFAPDMPPSGKLEVSTGQTYARRVRLTIHSVWHPDRPMHLERVVFR